MQTSFLQKVCKLAPTSKLNFFTARSFLACEYEPQSTLTSSLLLHPSFFYTCSSSLLILKSTFTQSPRTSRDFFSDPFHFFDHFHLCAQMPTNTCFSLETFSRIPSKTDLSLSPTGETDGGRWMILEWLQVRILPVPYVMLSCLQELVSTIKPYLQGILSVLLYADNRAVSQAA